MISDGTNASMEIEVKLKGLDQDGRVLESVQDHGQGPLVGYVRGVVAPGGDQEAVAFAQLLGQLACTGTF